MIKDVNRINKKEWSWTQWRIIAEYLWQHHYQGKPYVIEWDQPCYREYCEDNVSPRTALDNQFRAMT